MKQPQRYVAWKADKNLEYIPESDRILTGESKRRIIRHLAYEEGVPHQHNDVLVKCKDGTYWFVSKLS